MKLWPSESFEIETSISQREVVAFLKSEIDPKEWSIFEISSDGFTIARKIDYRNSSLPVVRGTFRPGKAGITVVITMQLYPRVIAFLYFCFGFLALSGVFLIIGSLIWEVPPSFGLLAPFIMLFIGWGFFSAGFWFEVKKQKPILLKFFQGKG